MSGLFGCHVNKSNVSSPLLQLRVSYVAISLS